jgi:hypothetical protein
MEGMSVATGSSTEVTDDKTPLSTKLWLMLVSYWPTLAAELETLLNADDPAATGHERSHRMAQMGARRIGSLAIGIGVVGIVLNEMSGLDIVANSTGVIDVSNIFQTAGSGLNLLVVGVIIAAAAVLLSLWSGF